MMKKICFNGCSFTFGEGFDPESREMYIYDRLLEKRFRFQRSNIAVPGSSNHEIFLRSVNALNSDNDIVVTQWSDLSRVWFYPGPGTVYAINSSIPGDYRYRYIYLDSKKRQYLRDMVLLLNHDYQNIFYLIDYCKCLGQIADHLGKKVVFVNGLLPWQEDLDHPITDNIGNHLSTYTKELLDFDYRDDAEIIEFFVKLETKFREIEKYRWVNIFDSFQKSIVDKGPEGHHPGIKSHEIMSDKIARYFISNSVLD